jgi:hypothetical protein
MIHATESLDRKIMIRNCFMRFEKIPSNHRFLMDDIEARFAPTEQPVLAAALALVA